MEFLPLLLIAVLFWFLVIRPQRRRNVRQAQLLDTLEPGQQVLTAGGLFGRIEQIGEQEILLEIAPGTTVRLDKHAVAGRVQDEPPEPETSG